MSSQLGASKAGVTFASGNAQDFGRAVRTALTDLESHRRAAEELGLQFRGFHSPENFVRRIMQPPGWRGRTGS